MTETRMTKTRISMKMCAALAAMAALGGAADFAEARRGEDDRHRYDHRSRDDHRSRSGRRSSDDGWRCRTQQGAKWMTIDQAAAKARAHGYRDIREVERDDGCWEVYATDKNGYRVEVYMHPVTGRIVKIERD